MAITRLGGANAISGTIPQGNIANSSLGAVTALPAGVGGKVLQVVEGTSSTQHNNTGGLADIGLSVAITPSSSSNKVLVVASFPYRLHETEYYASGQFVLLRDSTIIVNRSGSTAQDFTVEASINSVSWNYHNNATRCNIQKLDSPSTTSAITYKVQSGSFVGSDVQAFWNNVAGSIVAYEVAA